jgi:hypothetical protein
MLYEFLCYRRSITRNFTDIFTKISDNFKCGDDRCPQNTLPLLNQLQTSRHENLPGVAAVFAGRRGGEAVVITMRGAQTEVQVRGLAVNNSAPHQKLSANTLCELKTLFTPFNRSYYYRSFIE